MVLLYLVLGFLFGTISALVALASGADFVTCLIAYVIAGNLSVVVGYLVMRWRYANVPVPRNREMQDDLAALEAKRDVQRLELQLQHEEIPPVALRALRLQDAMDQRMSRHGFYVPAARPRGPRF